MGPQGRGGVLASKLSLFCALILLQASVAAVAGVSVAVSSGYEVHSALASPTVTQIYLTTDVAISIDTCPFPSHDMFQATLIDRNLNISSLPAAIAGPAANTTQQQLPGAQAAAASPTPGPAPAAAPAAPAGSFTFDCSYLSDRFEVQPGRTVTLSNLILRNCFTYSAAGVFRKAAGAMIVLDSVVDDQGSVCLQTHTAFTAPASQAPRPAGSPLPAAAGSTEQQQQQQQIVGLSEAGSNWCAAFGANSTTTSSSSGAQTAVPFRSPLPADSNSSLCQEQALLQTDVAVQAVATNTSNNSQPQPFVFRAVNSAVVCPNPVSPDCIQANGTDACLAAAYQAVNPDNNRPCPVTDGYSMHNCLVSSSATKVVLLQTPRMNLSTCPLQDKPGVIEGRNVTIMSDPRGPRIVFDCGLLSDRFQLQSGLTLTLHHTILANCSTTKPLSIVRMSNGSRLVYNDTFIVQPHGLCLPLTQLGGIAAHRQRPADVPGAQSLAPANPDAWCTSQESTTAGSSASQPPGSNVITDTTPSHNSSYSTIILSKDTVGLFANTTGFGPAYAATLLGPATAPFFVHPTWPSGMQLCTQNALIFRDYAYSDPHGWVDAGSSSGSGYNGSFTVAYLNSAVLCPDPLLQVGCEDPRNASACLAAAYSRANPDNMLLLPGAAADRGNNYGVRVVLPAVLASVGIMLLASLILGALFIRHRHKNAKGRAHMAAQKKGHAAAGPSSAGPNQQHTAGSFHWLTGVGSSGDTAGGGGGTSAASSGDPARRLLGIANYSPDGSGATSTGTRSLAHSAPDGITLSVLLGAGSFGRVYAGTWHGAPVAVKIITHSSADDGRISRELALSLSFDHPNLVRALHYTKMRINPNSSDASLGSPSPFGTSDLFLPEGAVGVFSLDKLPSTWAVIQRGTAGQPAPTIDTETWIVMDLMDRGNLAAALRHGRLFTQEGQGAANMARLLRRAADIAAGVSYLHSRNVCHGDLKCENVLLKSEGQDPDGLMAKVADFGLSRALAFGQSHLSTRRYGTVTHMPPELLVAGKLTPAADVYSFGIMMWEFVSAALPFAGLHHGEVIHRVVTEDLRPGPWPPASAQLPLPPGYIPLAQACWARQAGARPRMAQVLQRLMDMLAQVEQAAGEAMV